MAVLNSAGERLRMASAVVGRARSGVSVSCSAAGIGRKRPVVRSVAGAAEGSRRKTFERAGNREVFCDS
jgi:hypothetical protein